MWYPVLDEERGMVMNKSQPDLVEVVAEGGCLLLLEFETGELRRLDVSSFLKRGGAYEPRVVSRVSGCAGACVLLS